MKLHILYDRTGRILAAVHLDPAELVSPRPRARDLGSELDPLAADMQADGSLAARPGIGGSWRGAGGRWLLIVRMQHDPTP